MSALAFLTVFGGARRPDDGTFSWFPLVGAGIGGLLAAVWLGASELWASPVAAALVVTADLAVTGMLHLDGLADTADGVLPHLDRDRRLAVMSGPDVGAFAVGVVAVTLQAEQAEQAVPIDQRGHLFVTIMNLHSPSVSFAPLDRKQTTPSTTC